VYQAVSCPHPCGALLFPQAASVAAHRCDERHDYLHLRASSRIDYRCLNTGKLSSLRSTVKLYPIRNFYPNGLRCALSLTHLSVFEECDLPGMGAINFIRVVSMPFDENTYILYTEGLTDCIVVDPGLEPEKITAALTEKNLSVAAILNTHGHSDHIAGNEAMKEFSPNAPLVIGHGDAKKLTDPDLNLSAPFGLPFVSPPQDETVKQGDVYAAAGIDLEVRETPGHSAGHVIFVVKDDQRTIVLGGDVLFQGSIGRTDFPDGSFADLKRSVEEQFFTLPDESIILPGHGPATTVGDEKANNPFVGRPAGYQD